jgi:hypothetical protein
MEGRAQANIAHRSLLQNSHTKYKSPCIDPIPSELIKAGSRLIAIWNEEKLTEQ